MAVTVAMQFTAGFAPCDKIPFPEIEGNERELDFGGWCNANQRKRGNIRLINSLALSVYEWISYPEIPQLVNRDFRSHAWRSKSIGAYIFPGDLWLAFQCFRESKIECLAFFESNRQEINKRREYHQKWHHPADCDNSCIVPLWNSQQNPTMSDIMQSSSSKTMKKSHKTTDNLFTFHWNTLQAATKHAQVI